jgi:hypothetical protein
VVVDESVMRDRMIAGLVCSLIILDSPVNMVNTK